MAARRVLVFLAFISAFSSSQASDCSYNQLLDYLNVTASDSLLGISRPVKDWTRTTHVQLETSLYGIVDVDEKFQTVTCDIWVKMFWTNEFLTWDRSEFCGINSLTLPRSLIWIPDISIQEDVSDSQTVVEDAFVTLYNHGLINGNMRQHLTFTCQLDIFRFPFDEQQCNVTFFSMSSDDKSIKLGTMTNFTNIPQHLDEITKAQGEWKLKATHHFEYTVVADGIPQSKLVYMVTLQRKPFLYVINLILPLLFLLVLDLGSFFITEGKGEKLGFKVTILLSIFVLLLILKDILPSTEENLPMIAIYCVAIFTLVWISVLETMLVSFLMSLGGPYEERARSSGLRVNILLVADDDHKEPAGVGDKVPPEKVLSPVDPPGDSDMLKLILDKVKSVQLESKRKNKVKRWSGGCRRLAKIFDCVFTSVYFLTTAAFQIWIFSNWNKPRF
nr:5-hydroxytryptamine receptor 3A [Nothobranchius furzeri]